jgi:hypothetical protein
MGSPLQEKQELLNKYPRTYSIGDATRRAFDAIGLAPLAFVTALSVLDVAGLVNNTVTPFRLLELGICATLYACLVSRSARRRVILYEGGIAVSGLFSTRELKRSEILGRRMGRLAWQAGGGSFYIIVPADSATKELRLPAFLHMDKDFFSWMGRIPKIKNERERRS